VDQKTNFDDLWNSCRFVALSIQYKIIEKETIDIILANLLFLTSKNNGKRQQKPEIIVL